MLKKVYYKLPSFLQNYLNKAAYKVSNNLIENFIYSDIGKNFDLNVGDKKKIIKRIKTSLAKVESATNLETHLELGKKILSLNKNDKGFIVECGAFKGASSISLSIFSQIVDRKLIIYDSFEGLPEDNDQIEGRDYPHLKVTGVYKKGMYKGVLEEVQANLKYYGEYDNCIFRKGFFNETLKTHKEKIDFLFMDVDLAQSTKDCILYLWPFVNNEKYIFTDDACDIDVVSIWFDNEWWMKNLNCNAPGYVGSGCGIPIAGKYSSLGYSIKNPIKSNYEKAQFLY